MVRNLKSCAATMMVYLVLSVALPSSGHAQCVYPNGDTSIWGWDNTIRQSCPPVVTQVTPTNQPSSGSCSYPNGDVSQWGWDEVNRQSCPPIRSSVIVDSAAGNCSYPNDDTSQWGWDDVAKESCPPVAAEAPVLPASDGNCSYPNGDTSQWGWDETRRQSCPPIAEDTEVAAGDNVVSTGSCVYPGGDTSQWGWDDGSRTSCPPLSGSDSNDIDTGSNTLQRSYPFNITALPRVSHDWTSGLRNTWSGLKSRNIDRYNTGMVHRPRSEQPGDAVSEGIGYGMILALYSNDQSYFNSIWDGGERTLWNGRFYDWRSDQFGNIIGTGAATDAEQDIAMMLIFADHLVNEGIWSPHVSPQGATYASRAQDLLDLIWSDMIDGGRYLRPGNFWGGRDLTNIGYFSPAWYRLYQQFDARADHNWQAVIDQGYQTISAGAGYSRGLVADWSDAWGNTLAEGPGYNAYDNGQSMFKDGIRIYWRLATDALWFQESRATQFLRNAMAFLQQQASASGTAAMSNSPAHLANFYQLDGSQVPETDIWTEFNGGNSQRSRNEHSHLTIGMWASAAIGSGDVALAERFSRQLQSFYEGGSYWGKTTDTSGNNETFANNESYFDQFLAWFGAITLNGNFCNMLTCLNE